MSLIAFKQCEAITVLYTLLTLTTGFLIGFFTFLSIEKIIELTRRIGGSKNE